MNQNYVLWSKSENFKALANSLLLMDKFCYLIWVWWIFFKIKSIKLNIMSLKYDVILACNFNSKLHVMCFQKRYKFREMLNTIFISNFHLTQQCLYCSSNQGQKYMVPWGSWGPPNGPCFPQNTFKFFLKKIEFYLPNLLILPPKLQMLILSLVPTNLWNNYCFFFFKKRKFNDWLELSQMKIEYNYNI